MKLAKPHLDIAVMTDQLQAMLDFWQGPAGLTFEELLPTGGGNHQHRHGVNGSVFKLNHSRDGLPKAAQSGYRGMWIARDDIDSRQELLDPDGNRVVLVPRGENDVEGVAVVVAVSDPAAHARFYTEALQLEALGEGRFRCGDSLLIVEHDANANADVGIYGQGFRYLTIQVFDCRAEHARILQIGAAEGAPPRKHGETALYSMVRDPDGNWVEISQRASLTGPLPDM
ncbi:MAG: catechol 2,3-dioxygenase-like lactoylglutathione lyase family enzyme [Myxococcota bacterium]|jgi:catechol 2,3-dioxygenase-like lactoylglutathione lyase family enzyme